MVAGGRAEGLIVITRAARIRYRPVERAHWIASGVRGFVLTGRTSQSTQSSLQLLDRAWKQIEELRTSRPEGPWMYSVTRSGLRELGLQQ